MIRWLKRQALRSIRFLFSDRVARLLALWLSKPLVRHLRGEATFALVLLLLAAMDTAFWLLKGYRENIEGFSAIYRFRTDDQAVLATVYFANGDMKYDRDPLPIANCTVDFKTAKALRRFLLSAHQDILESLQLDEVHVHGNLNYVYRFGFLARDLEHRILGDP